MTRTAPLLGTVNSTGYGAPAISGGGGGYTPSGIPGSTPNAPLPPIRPDAGPDPRNAYQASDGRVYRCGNQPAGLPGGTDDGSRSDVAAQARRESRRLDRRTLSGAAVTLSPCPPNGSPPPGAPSGPLAAGASDAPTLDTLLDNANTDNTTGGSRADSTAAVGLDIPTVALAVGAALALLLVIR